MQFYILDFPAGYVARSDGYRPVGHPNATKNEIFSQLPTVLKLILKGK